MPQTWRRAAIVTLAGAMLLIFLSYVCRMAWSGLFEVDNPTVFARLYRVWVVLAYVVPGLVVGFFAARHVIALTATAYGLGYTFLILRQLAHRPFDVPDFVTWQQLVLALIRELAPAPLVGIVVAILVAYLRRRLTIGSSDRGVTSSVSQGGDR
jgi:hypothetical protein